MSLAYCPKCKRKRVIMQPYIRNLANGRLTEQGTCSECSTNISRFLTYEEQLYLHQLKQEEEAKHGKDTDTQQNI